MGLAERYILGLLRKAERNAFSDLGTQCSVNFAEGNFQNNYSIARKIVGECFRRYGEKLFEKDGLMGLLFPAANAESAVRMQTELGIDTMHCLAEFNTAYLDRTMQTGGENVQDMCFFWLGTPPSYPQQFEDMVDEGAEPVRIAAFYREHKAHIDEKIPKAGQFVGFLETIADELKRQ